MSYLSNKTRPRVFFLFITCTHGFTLTVLFVYDRQLVEKESIYQLNLSFNGSHRPLILPYARPSPASVHQILPSFRTLPFTQTSRPFNPPFHILSTHSSSQLDIPQTRRLHPSTAYILQRNVFVHSDFPSIPFFYYPILPPFRSSYSSDYKKRH